VVKRTLATWKNESDTMRPQLRAAERGAHGIAAGLARLRRKDYIDHPDTPERQKAVEAIRAQHASDRFAMQKALMPTSTPASGLRGRNERIDERF